MSGARARGRQRVLIADDEAISRDFLADALGVLGYDAVTARDGDEALVRLGDREIDVVLTDLQMPGRSGIEVLRAAKAADPDRPVVLVTAHGTMSVAIEVMRGGADDILEKPVTVEELELALLRVAERARLRRENRFHRTRSLPPGSDLLVASDAMRAVLDTVARVAASPATVLIRGESGTGKERVAAELHRQSDRADGPFVKVNTAAVPDGLMESEFFGHEAGAFTGATRRRQGCFELADGGTLFLDEIGDMPAALQAKLLRVIQDGEFTRVGGSRTTAVDVRLVAATHRDLAADVAAGRFREDLFYRLDVVPIVVPPLRERRDDIVPLAERFLSRGVRLSPSAREVLVAHDWPGNVRELQNLMQRACLLATGGVVDAVDLRRWLGPGRAVLEPASGVAPQGLDPVGMLIGRPLRDVEDELIRRTLDHHQGNRTQAARTLGIGVRTLFNRLRDGAPTRA